MKRKPFIITYHGDADPGYGKLIRRVGVSLFDIFATDRILSSAKIIISPSEYYIDQSNFLPKYKNTTIAIPNGVNPQEIEVHYTKDECKNKLGFTREEKIILFLGVLINYKSPDLLIESLPLIIEKIPEATLVFAGDGPLRKDMELRADKLNLADKVKFAGNVAGELKALYYNAADVFVLPSTMKTECFGIVLLEAAAAGLPIVVSNLSAFHDFIEDGYNGLMTSVGDIKSLAEAVIRILSEPDLSKEIGENAREKIKDFAWEKIAAKTEKIYDQVTTSI